MATDSWRVERKMHSGQWENRFGGYETEAKAMDSAARHGKSAFHTTRWRVLCDGGPDEGRIVEAEFVPGNRAVWTVMQEAHK